ncbi:MAG: putative Ntn-hydrolase superfamily protein, partial [Candidatus Azotimanducaceae bacterium]
MKKSKGNLILLALFTLQQMQAQHTFSIVAVDPLTGEIGNAGATCLDIDDLNGEEGALVISDIILNTGAISSQAAWNPINQAAARARMELGDSPQEIIDWLVANDPAPGTAPSRQYGVVDL